MAICSSIAIVERVYVTKKEVEKSNGEEGDSSLDVKRSISSMILTKN